MARVKSLVGLVVCVLLEWEAVSGHIRLERPCGEDNLSCPRIGNLSQIPLQCFTRQELCNGIDFCSSGTDEGTDIASLKCDPERPENSLFQCTPDIVVSIFALCDGVNDCGLGNDETTTLCENKCLGPYNGGCPYTRDCLTSEFDVSCGDCLSGFMPDPANSSTAADCIDIDECASRYHWYQWYRWRRYSICGPRSRCANTEGSFTCMCVYGYVWNGHRCIRGGGRNGRHNYWRRLLYRIYYWRFFHRHI